MIRGPSSAAQRLLRPALVLAGLLVLTPVALTTSASSNQVYSEGGGSDEHGNDAFWRISSAAQPLSPSASTACNAIRASVFLAPSTVSLDTSWRSSSPVLYCYIYTVKNNGATRIKVSLPGPDVIRSPLTTVMQDFSIEVDPHGTATLVFVAESDPRETFSPVDIAIWDTAAEQWGFIRSGPVSLYLPSRPNLIGVASGLQRGR